MTDARKPSEKPKLSRPMVRALRDLDTLTRRTGGYAESFFSATPGTLRALQKRGLITCDRFYAAKDVRFTDAGRAALVAANKRPSHD